jgi:hypothetical protein
MNILFSGGSGKSNQLCVGAVPMSQTTMNNRGYTTAFQASEAKKSLCFALHCPHELLCYTILMYCIFPLL